MQTQLGTRSGLAAAHAPRCLVPTGLPRSRRSLRAHASAGARVEPSSSTSWSSAVGDDRDAAQTSTTASAPPGAINPGAVVEAFVASLNSRSFEDIEVLLAPDCVLDDLTHNQVFSSSAAVANALRAVVGATSMGMRLAMETVRVHRFSMNVSLTWHLEVAGVAVPGTTGHSFYRVRHCSQQAVHSADSAAARPPRSHCRVLLPHVMAATRPNGWREHNCDDLS